jgi:hypothetical protein
MKKICKIQTEKIRKNINKMTSNFPIHILMKIEMKIIKKLFIEKKTQNLQSFEKKN